MVSMGNHVARNQRAALLPVICAVLLASCGKDQVTTPSEPVNARPVADAGLDRAHWLHDTVTLDGGDSRDADGDQLTFRWELLATPAGSHAALSDPTAVSPDFAADVEGDFVAELVVNDGALESTPDTVTIQVDRRPGISTFPRVVGAGLQVMSSASLEVTDHGGVTVRIASGDSTLALVAPDENTPGSPYIDVDVPDGNDSALYVVQGIAGTTGPVTVTASALGFTDGAATILVVQPGVTIDSLASAQSFGTNDVFTVSIGIPNPAGTGLDSLQGASATNAPPLVLTVTSSNGSAGHVTVGGSTDATIEIELPAGVFQQDVTFEPLAAGVTVVAASIPGFLTPASGSVDVTVDQPGISTLPRTLGAGLQVGNSASLDIADHGGVTVRIASADSTVALIAPDENTTGSAAIDVVVTDGNSIVPYVVQGVAGTTGAVTVTVSAPGFADGTAVITVVQPGVTINGLAGAQSVGNHDDFMVSIGVPDTAGPGLDSLQGASAANVTPLVLTLTSSSGTAGRVWAAGNSGATIAIDLTPGVSQHDVTFEPLAAGTTVVSASVPGFVTLTSPSVSVSDDRPGISPFSRTIGAGLQFDHGASLDITDHGGVTVRIESDDPTVALIAPNATTPGSPYIDVVVADRDGFAPYVVQGVARTTGTVTVTASAPDFRDGTGTITVVQPAVAIGGLAGTQSVGTDEVFLVFVGIPDAAGTGLDGHQDASAANVPALALTVSSSDGAVGHVSAAGSTNATVTFDLPAGEFQTSATFVPQSGGLTTVSARIPGFLSTPSATVDVAVDQPAMSAFSRTIGAGLQFGHGAILDIADHGGVTVHIESGDPSVALIAPDETTPGSPFIDVVVADGDDFVPYVVQGVAGTTGIVTVTASAPGFANGTGTITVVQPGLIIGSLAETQSVGTNDVFTVFLGIPNGAGTGLGGFQGASAANVPPLLLTVTSSNGTVGHASAAGSAGATIEIDLTAGVFQQNVTFEPLAVGNTVVSVSIPGFVTLTPGVDITVGEPGISALSRTIGAGLQFSYGASLDISDHGGVTVRIDSGDSTVALVAPDATTPGSPFIDVVVADGDDFAAYVVQGVAGATGTVAVTASAPGFATGTGTITVVQPGLMIGGLVEAQSVGTSDVFTVYVGIPNAAGTGLSSFQVVSAANVPPLVLTVMSSDGTVGQMSAANGTGATTEIDFTAGVFQQNVTFEPLAAGSTTVSVSIPGFLPTTAATVDVTVNQ